MKNSRIAFGLAISLYGFSSAASEVCAGSKVIATCETLSKLGQNINGAKELSLPRLDDSIIHNAAGTPLGPDDVLQPPTPLQLKTAEQIIETLREAAKKEVMAGKSREFLTKEQKAMLSRLENLRVVIQKSGQEQCRPPSPDVLFLDAKYLPHAHEISICPNVTKLAPASLKMLVAHELGHVISPCAMSREAFRVNAKVMKSKNVLKNCGIKDAAGKGIVQEMSESRMALFSPASELAGPFAKTVRSLIACKALVKQADEGGFQEAVIFGSQAKCLNQAYAATFRDFKAAVKDRMVPSVLRMDQAAKIPQKCLGTQEEHFAESFGAHLFAQQLESSSDQKNEARIGVSQMQGYACLDQAVPPEPGARFDYPSSEDRLKIQFADPRMGKALSCQAPETKLCVFSRAASAEGKPAQTSKTTN